MAETTTGQAASFAQRHGDTSARDLPCIPALPFELRVPSTAWQVIKTPINTTSRFMVGLAKVRPNVLPAQCQSAGEVQMVARCKAWLWLHRHRTALRQRWERCCRSCLGQGHALASRRTTRQHGTAWLHSTYLELQLSVSILHPR